MAQPPKKAAIVMGSRAQRFVARLVDLMLFLPGAAIIAETAHIQGESEWSTESVTAVLGGVAVLWILLFPLPLMLFERTLGKALVGLRVVRLRNGKRIGFWRAAVRELFHLLVSFIPIVGLLNQLACLWEPYRQCWHDKLIGSIVVDRSTFAAR